MSTVAVDPRIRARRVSVARDAGRRRLRRLLALGAVVGVGLIALALTWTPVLDVEEVQVRGADRAASAVVREAAGVAPGDSLAWLDPAAAERAVEALPWVGDATVRRSWSGTVVIEVTERTAVAALAGDDGVWRLADETGRVLALADSPPVEVAVVDGVITSARPGEALDAQVDGALVVAAGLPAALRTDGVTVIGAGDDVEIVLAAGGVVVLGGPDEAAAKLQAAAAVLATVPPSCVERLDVSLPAAPALVRVPGCS